MTEKLANSRTQRLLEVVLYGLPSPWDVFTAAIGIALASAVVIIATWFRIWTTWTEGRTWQSDDVKTVALGWLARIRKVVVGS